MFKRVFMLNMLLSSLTVLPGTKAHATDVNITGKVIASSCTVSPVLVAGQEVNLGALGRTQFLHANDAGTWKSFALNLTNCPAGTTTVKATYTGTPDGTNATLFANTEPVATAALNMAVQMAKDSDHTAVLSTGSVMSVDVDTQTGTATFPLAARLYTPTGGTLAGQVSSSVLVNFTYQ